MKYQIAIHQAEEGGYWVSVPALPGCYSQGEDMDATLENIKEAIAVHLEVLAEDAKEEASASPLPVHFAEVAV